MTKPYGIEADLLRKWQHSQKQIKELEEECRLLSELSSSQDESLATLEQQNAELVAHCESIATTAKEFMSCPSDVKTLFELKDLINQTPQQSLNKIKADAIDRAIDTSAKVQTYGEDNKCIRVLTLQEYAEEIRKESK